MTEHLQKFFVEYSQLRGQIRPTSVFRRDLPVEGPPRDYYVGKGGVWTEDSRYSLGSFLMGRGDRDLDEITSSQADEFVEMARTRELRPFSTRETSAE
jgi:hypothetical protein